MQKKELIIGKIDNFIKEIEKNIIDLNEITILKIFFEIVTSIFEEIKIEYTTKPKHIDLSSRVIRQIRIKEPKIIDDFLKEYIIKNWAGKNIGINDTIIGEKFNDVVQKKILSEMWTSTSVNRIINIRKTLFTSDFTSFKETLEKIDKNIKDIEIKRVYDFVSEKKYNFSVLINFMNFVKDKVYITSDKNSIFYEFFDIMRKVCFYISHTYSGYNSKEREEISFIIEKFVGLQKRNVTEKESLQHFIDEIKKIYIYFKNKHEYEIVFRAATKKRGYNEKEEYLIENEKPSIFHGNNKHTNLIYNEDIVYNSFIATNPKEFENMTTFDQLTKMRHYEVQNRLLDVTKDPLLALLFACGENNDGTGKIFLYKVKKENTKEYNSDTVTILSTLTKLKKHHKEQLKQILNIFKKGKDYYISEDIIDMCYYKNGNKRNITFDNSSSLMMIDGKKCDFKYSKELNRTIMECDNEKIDIDKIIPNYNGIEKKIRVKEFFNYLVSKIVGELNWQLKKEIPGWHEGIFDLETFTQCYLVKPKMNNPRIVAQSGAFFIYPFEDTDIRKSLVDGAIYQIDIDEIKKELSLLNIGETKYIPDDLTKYAVEIREKYKNA
ncbi:MAG: FRG domain-containing protein [Elusimicrobia bacterium]|nr:FRG domain-containing protein [Elusimicrobiota bacterium]